ncbi:hypothetical protein HYV57_04590 [Candidatus Peregrinibacteria bacterium]|nr:hypothetical protein [Candidatus Peregrinibacteria bacterium]
MNSLRLIPGGGEALPTDEKIRDNILTRVAQYGDTLYRRVVHAYGLQATSDNARQLLFLHLYLGCSPIISVTGSNTSLTYGLIDSLGTQCPPLSEAISGAANPILRSMERQIGSRNLYALQNMPEHQIVSEGASFRDPFFTSLFHKNSDLFLRENVAYCRAVYLLALRRENNQKKVLYSFQQNFLSALYSMLVEVFGADDPLLKKIYIAMDRSKRSEIEKISERLNNDESDCDSAAIDKISRMTTKRVKELEGLEGLDLDRARAQRRHGEEDEGLIDLANSLTIEGNSSEHQLYRCLCTVTVPFASLMTEVIRPKSLNDFLSQEKKI